MPTISQSFGSKRGDVYNNLVVTVRDTEVGISVLEYTRHGEITLSREEARRLVAVLTTELDLTENP